MVMLLSLLAIFGGNSRAVSMIELENLVRVSDLVVVGEVVDVRTVPYGIPAAKRTLAARLPDDLPIAELRVDRVLKGTPETSRVLFVAAGSWTCDTTEAVRGELGLYFLESKAIEEAHLGDLRKAVDDTFGPRDLLSVQWSGRGRMPLRDVDGRAFASYWHEVIMSRDLESIPGPDREWIRSAALAGLERQIARFVEVQSGPWLRFSVEDQPEQPARSWSIRGDGTYVLDSRSQGAPIAPRSLRLDDHTLFELGIVFATQDRNALFLPPVLDSSQCGGGQGTLEVFSGDELHVIPIRAEAFQATSDDDEWRYEVLLDAWGTLYATDAEVGEAAPR